MAETKFLRAGIWTKRINGVLLALHRVGIGAAGSRTLTVVGRKSGQPRTTPVNPLRIGDAVYLVAPRGTTEWVRNLRAAGRGTLARGRRETGFSAVEVPVDERLPVLKEYLRRWAWEVGMFFDLPKNPTDEQIVAVQHLHPVFGLRRV